MLSKIGMFILKVIVVIIVCIILIKFFSFYAKTVPLKFPSPTSPKP